jgi:hypothetical protein
MKNVFYVWYFLSTGSTGLNVIKQKKSVLLYIFTTNSTASAMTYIQISNLTTLHKFADHIRSSVCLRPNIGA